MYSIFMDAYLPVLLLCRSVHLCLHHHCGIPSVSALLLLLCSQGCSVFRVIPGQLIQSGDMISQDGLGGESVFGGKFEDENLDGCARHDAAGCLSMANDGTSVRTSTFVLASDREKLNNNKPCRQKNTW